jgi:hypothetical protein
MTTVDHHRINAITDAHWEALPEDDSEVREFVFKSKAIPPKYVLAVWVHIHKTSKKEFMCVQLWDDMSLLMNTRIPNRPATLRELLEAVHTIMKLDNKVDAC